MAYSMGPITVVGDGEDPPTGEFVRVLPYEPVGQYYPWWSSTTRAMIEAMPLNFRGQTVIDLGCGTTAILAIIAARRFAERVFAIERVPAIAEWARRHILLNGCDVQLEVGTEPPLLADFMVANLGDGEAVKAAQKWAKHGLGTDDEGRIIRW